MRISKVRLPVKAGTRTIAATFLKDTRAPGRRHRSTPRRRRADLFRRRGQHLGRGPLQSARAGRDRQPREDLHLPARPGLPKKWPARKRSSRRSRAAPIAARSTADDMPQLLALYKAGARGGRVRGGHPVRAAEDPGVAGIPVPCGARSAGCRAGQRLSRQRHRAGVAPVVLPLEQHSRR